MTRSKRMGKKRLILLVGGAVLIVAVVAAAVVFGLLWWQGVSKAESETTKAIKEVNSSKENVSNEAHALYDDVHSEVLYSDPTTWTREEVDQVYYYIAYNEKYEAYTSVLIGLDRLDAAKDAGVDIDDNSLGLGESYRKQLRDKANAAVSSYGQPGAVESTEGQVPEGEDVQE